MKTTHVTEAFAEWAAETMDPAARNRVDAHLASCPECESYFEQMAAAMATMSPGALPELEPDPHLPTRIRAIAEARAQQGARSSGRVAWLRTAFAGGAFALAAAIGVYVGYGAATAVTAPRSIDVVQSNGSTDVFDVYYEALSQSGFEDGWSQWESEDTP